MNTEAANGLGDCSPGDPDSAVEPSAGAGPGAGAGALAVAGASSYPSSSPISNCDSDHPSAAEASPEVLGSVVQQSHGSEGGDKSNCVPLRTSARVIKKMRLDYIASQAPPDKKDVPKEEDKLDVKPKKRSWEQWPLEDKNIFFEALNEYGKDFDAIQKYFEAKAKRKNLPESLVKNKEQIRYFYYRTWHKISKHLRFPDEVKKATQELYGLINFGELRKKIGGVSEKTSLKLNELIYRGFTQIRVRGKTLRIKTPICRALRKLNQQEELAEDLKLPTRVTVELKPRTNEAWARVQATAQNPRLQTLLPLQRRLSTLLSFLQQRWQPRSVRHCERLQSQLEEVAANISSINESSAQPSSSGTGNAHDECPMEVDEAGIISSSPQNAVPHMKPAQVLRVAPQADATIAPLTVNISEYFTSTRLSLNSHEGRLGNHAAEEMFNSMLLASNKGCGRRGSKRQRQDSSSEKKKEQLLQPSAIDSSPEKSKDSTISSSIISVPSLNIQTDNEDDKQTCPFRLFGTGVCLDASSSSADSGHGDSKVNGYKCMAVGEEKSPTFCKEYGDSVGSGTPLAGFKPQESSSNPNSGVLGSTSGEAPEEVISRVRSGWTLNNAKAITIGELYLMFGSESKIVLEYWWEDPSSEKTTVSADVFSDKSPPHTTSPAIFCETSKSVGSDVNGLKSDTPATPKLEVYEVKSESPANTQLALTLQKLLSIAKMYSEKNKTLHCPCGHVCNGIPKASVPKPKVPKPVRFNIDCDKPKTEGGADNTSSMLGTPLFTHSDGPFRRPLMPSPQFKPPPRPGTVEAFKAQLEKFRPRFCNRRGRPVSVRKNVVVPRMLPLLPKAPASPSLLTLQVIPQGGQMTGEFLPITQSPSVLNYSPTPANIIPIRPTTCRKSTDTSVSTAAASTTTSASSSLPDLTSSISGTSVPDLCQGSPKQGEPLNEGSCQQQGVRLVQDVFPPTLETPVSSPPSISNLLDLNLPNELNLHSSPLLESNFSGLLSSGNGSSSSPPPSSPSTILKEDENQWLTEVADFSLSSFLGHLESPLKATQQELTDSSDQNSVTSDVEAQMQCLMTENSLDYMAKFADLAAQIASDGTSKN